MNEIEGWLLDLYADRDGWLTVWLLQQDDCMIYYTTSYGTKRRSITG